MEQGFYEGLISVIAGFLFLKPLLAVWRRFCKKLGKKKGISFLEYNFPSLYKRTKRKKSR